MMNQTTVINLITPMSLTQVKREVRQYLGRYSRVTASCASRRIGMKISMNRVDLSFDEAGLEYSLNLDTGTFCLGNEEISEPQKYSAFINVVIWMLDPEQSSKVDLKFGAVNG